MLNKKVRLIFMTFVSATFRREIQKNFEFSKTSDGGYILTIFTSSIERGTWPTNILMASESGVGGSASPLDTMDRLACWLALLTTSIVHNFLACWRNDW